MYAKAVGEKDEDDQLSLAGYVGAACNSPREFERIMRDVPNKRRIAEAGEFGTDHDRAVEFFRQKGFIVREENG